MNWINVLDDLPEPYTEVLVLIDGKRGALWTNNHCLVAYLNQKGEWLQERCDDEEPLIGVISWSYIEYP